MIEFRLDAHSRVATYTQLVQQVKQAVRLGRLDPGDRLPAVREVAESLAINPNTVLKAYRELELAGVVEARAGVGTFVRAPARRLLANQAAAGARAVDLGPPGPLGRLGEGGRGGAGRRDHARRLFRR